MASLSNQFSDHSLEVGVRTNLCIIHEEEEGEQGKWPLGTIHKSLTLIPSPVFRSSSLQPCWYNQHGNKKSSLSKTAARQSYCTPVFVCICKLCCFAWFCSWQVRRSQGPLSLITWVSINNNRLDLCNAIDSPQPAHLQESGIQKAHILSSTPTQHSPGRSWLSNINSLNCSFCKCSQFWKRSVLKMPGNGWIHNVPLDNHNTSSVRSP